MNIILGGKRGGIAIVDDDLFEQLPGLRVVKWHVGHEGYVRGRFEGEARNLHRIIGTRLLGCAIDQVVDHRDGNKLDCRRTNLRPCAQRLNAANTPMKKNNTSGITGVSWDKSRGKWLANIKVNRKFINLGWHERIEDAAAARAAAERLHFGEFAYGAPRTEVTIESLSPQENLI